MNKYPVKRNQRSVRETKTESLDVIAPAGSFFTFRYSHTEISATGDSAHVKASQTRFEDGKLTTETFEGDVDRTVYERMAGDAQRYFLNQTALLAGSLSWFLPFWRKSGSGRD